MSKIFSPTGSVLITTGPPVATHQQRRGGSINFDRSIDSQSLALILDVQHQRILSYLDCNQSKIANLRLSNKPILIENRDWQKTGPIVFLSTQAANRIANWIYKKQMRRELRLQYEDSGKRSKISHFLHTKEV